MKSSLYKKIVISLLLLLLLIIGSAAVVYFFFPHLLGEAIASRYTLPEDQSEQVGKAISAAYENSNIEYDEMEYILNQVSPKMVMEGFSHFGDDPIRRSDLMEYIGSQVDLGSVTPEELDLFTEPLLPDTLPPLDVLLDGFSVSEQMVAIVLPVVKSELLRHLESGGSVEPLEVDLFFMELEDSEGISTQELSSSGPEDVVIYNEPLPEIVEDAAGYSEELIQEEVSKLVTKEDILNALRTPTDDQVYEILTQVVVDDFIEYEEFLQYVEEIFPDQEEELLQYTYDTLVAIEDADQSLSSFAQTFSSFPPFQQKAMIRMFRPILIQYVENNF